MDKMIMKQWVLRLILFKISILQKLCGCVHMNADAHGNLKMSGALELKLQVVVNHLMWVLENELQHSVRWEWWALLIAEPVL